MEITISLISLVLSITASIFTYCTWWIGREDLKMEQAPNLVLNDLEFNQHFPKCKLAKNSENIIPIYKQMKFARIPYYENSEENIFIEKMLIINLSENGNIGLKSAIKFDTFTLSNIGFDLTQIKAKKLQIKWHKKDKQLIIDADENLNIINESIANSNNFKFSVSLFYDESNPPFDKTKLTNEGIVRKMKLTNGKLLNTFYGQDMADLISEWKITFELTNKYNKVYEQDITLSVGIDSTFTYTTNSSTPKLLKLSN